VLADVPWTLIGHANGVRAMAALSWLAPDGSWQRKLFVATADNRLWARDPVLANIDWTPIGHAIDVCAMTALQGRLLAATTDNRLWVREPDLSNVNWTPIGHANAVTALAAGEAWDAPLIEGPCAGPCSAR
jgi:hypothetical protein